MSYDKWKTTNPDDETLGPEPVLSSLPVKCPIHGDTIDESWCCWKCEEEASACDDFVIGDERTFLNVETAFNRLDDIGISKADATIMIECWIVDALCACH